MYGSWLGVTLGGIGLLMLVLAAALTAWTPLFAIAIFAAIATVMLLVAAMRRSEDMPGRQTHRGDPESYAAPAGGEGAAGSEKAAAAEPAEAEQAPEGESSGAWGESR